MTPVEALRLMLDMVDYTSGNCAPTEMVGAVLPKEVIERCRFVLSAPSADGDIIFQSAKAADMPKGDSGNSGYEVSTGSRY